VTLPQRIRGLGRYPRAVHDDPTLIADAISWLQALAEAEVDGSVPVFIQRGGVTSTQWGATRITYRVRLDEDGHVSVVELWNIERVAAEAS
jgi:hypothetical protein